MSCTRVTWYSSKWIWGQLRDRVRSKWGTGCKESLETDWRCPLTSDLLSSPSLERGIVLQDLYIICVKVKNPIVGESLQLSASSFASPSGQDLVLSLPGPTLDPGWTQVQSLVEKLRSHNFGKNINRIKQCFLSWPKFITKTAEGFQGLPVSAEYLHFPLESQKSKNKVPFLPYRIWNQVKNKAEYRLMEMKISIVLLRKLIVKTWLSFSSAERGKACQHSTLE